MTHTERALTLVSALVLGTSLAGCNDVQTPGARPPSAPPSSSAPGPEPEPTGSLDPPAPPSEPPDETEPVVPVPESSCDAGDDAFVRRATLALLGRRPLGQGEVLAHVQALSEIRNAQVAANAPDTARRLVARAMMHDDAFRVRWTDFLKDGLRIARTQAKSQRSCYGEHESVSPDGGALAKYVRDNPATASQPPVPSFTMRELLASALELDDLSVLYRAHLFAMMSKPINGAALELELELTRRNDFGAAFESAYTRRDIACLACHNSEYSITASTDPATNRFWPVPALFERALFGSSSGLHPPEEAEQKGSDLLRARGMFRYMGVVDASGTTPFGWSEACGQFTQPMSDDPLHIDTWFGSIRSTPEAPSLGLRASVWDLERSLQRGVEALVRDGLPASGGEVAPDVAFAALVALTIVENVWTEVMGSRLTVAHNFPRTAVQRDLLVALTDRFVRARFSLKTLLLDILEHEAFNLKPPSAGCGSGPYPLDRIFDPWTDAEADPAMRGNGPSDAVFPLSPRLIRRSLHVAMGWPMYPEYPAPSSAEETLSLAIGFFLRDGEAGRRGLDFQGRLAWEAAYGSCHALSENDFIARLVESGAADPTATALDAVLALKDRLVGDPRVTDAERPLLESLLQLPLSSRDWPALEGGLRRVCGVLVASPLFMLGGLVPDAVGELPRLTPSEASTRVACERLRDALAAVAPGTALSCSE